jgi:hypothetical protein
MQPQGAAICNRRFAKVGDFKSPLLEAYLPPACGQRESKVERQRRGIIN